jgi:O-antigen/teichoic acid export membrane protein
MMIRAIRNIWNSQFFRNVATLISGTSLAQVFSLVIYIILGRIYTEQDFGIFGLYMNILNITVIFSTAKYELAILLPKRDKDSLNLMALSGIISVFVGLLLLLIVVPLNGTICRWLGSEDISPWLYFIPLSTLLVGWFTSFRNFSNRHKRYKLIAGANIGQSVSNSLLKLGLGFLIAGASGLIIGAVFGQLVGFLVFFLVHLRLQVHRSTQIRWKEMIRLGRKYILFPKYNLWQGLINTISAAFPVFILSSYFSTGMAGFYTFGYMVLYRPVNLVANAFYQVMFQRFTEKIHGNDPIGPEVRLFLKRNIQVLLLPFIIAGIFFPEIFEFVFSSKWIEAGKYAQILLPWIFMVSLVMPLSFIPDLYKKQRVAMIIDALKLVARLGGLVVGVILENVYLALALYSGFSTLIIGYSLIWYLQLVKTAPPKDDKLIPVPAHE